MGQRNISSNQMSNLQHDQQAQNPIHPQPSVSSGSTSNNPQPSMSQILPVAGSVPVSYPMIQYNTTHNHPLPGNSAPITTSNYYNPYMTLPSSSLYPPQTNQGPQFVTGLGGANKGKSSEAYSNSVVGPSSMVPLSVEIGSQQRPGPVVASPISRSVEVEYRGIVRPGPFVAGPSSMVPLPVEVGSQQSMRPGPVVAGPSSMVPVSAEVGSEPSVRSGPVGGETVLVQTTNHLIQGNFQGHALIPANAPWGWSQVPVMPYMNGSGATGSGIVLEQNQVVQATNFQFYPALVYPLQGHLQPLYQMPQLFHASYSQEVGPSFGQIIRSGPLVGPGFEGHVPTMGLGMYDPSSGRPLVSGVTMRPHTLPHLRFLPADGVAILEVPSHYQIVNSTDQHSTMRMDVDGMSYEELLALGERIGSVGTGLSENTISSHLQTRTYASSASSVDTEADFCTICLSNYENQQKIGKLDCGHEYHVDCVKQWLVNKNTCPICKCPALTTTTRESTREG